MPLVLGKRADVAPKERVDRSGLTNLDWCAIAVDNAWRQAHFAMVDADERAHKLARLDTLLDDPDLAQTHSPNDPDRLDAIARHAELHFERVRFTKEARKAAKDVAALWEKVPSKEWQRWLRDGFALAFADSALWSLVANDPTLPHTDFWRGALVTWRERDGKEMPPCPF